MDPPEVFRLLESNSQADFEAAKKNFSEFFGSTKDSWLMNGIVDYFVASGTLRCVEIIASVREPHDLHFFNKMYDSLRSSQANRRSLLTLLSHLVYKQPIWIHKIAPHNLFKELLKILKHETDIINVISGLLTLTVLLPMIPAYVQATLPDIFEVFSRLAAWNAKPNELSAELLIHLQVSLHSLFSRLYGMYPCNLLSYLRKHYTVRDNLGVFAHTIRPMLETVRMHPFLVVYSKETETTTNRWRKMEQHDVIAECARYAIDTRDDSCNASGFRDRTESDSRRTVEKKYPQLKSTPSIESRELKDLWSPSLQGASSIPLSAESAPASIPQTPIMQSYVSSSSFAHQEGTSPPEAAIEATPETTPVKDPRMYATARSPLVHVGVSRALNQMGAVKRSSAASTPTPSSQPSSPMRKESSPFRFPESAEPKVTQRKLQNIINDRQTVQAGKDVQNGGVKLDEPDDLEDQEVLEISQQGEMRIHSNTTSTPINSVSRRADNDLRDFQPLDLENISCYDGGLHMPLKVIKVFTRRIRYYSQCANENDSAQDSGGKRNSSDPTNNSTQQVVRRAQSLPDIKKNRRSFTGPESGEGGLDESVEEAETGVVDAQTQTSYVIPTPYPYEHLFQSLFPQSEPKTESSESKAESDSKVPPPRLSPITDLDRYLDMTLHYQHVEEPSASTSAVPLRRSNSVDSELKAVKDQLILLHLQLKFERHRRDVHAERNRRLLGKARNIRWMEDHNNALREQLKLIEEYKAAMEEKMVKMREECFTHEKRFQEDVKFWQDKCTNQDKIIRELKAENERLTTEMQLRVSQNASTSKNLLHAEGQIFSLNKELKQVSAQASLSEELKAQMHYLNHEMVILGEKATRSGDQLARISELSDQSPQLCLESYQENVATLTAKLNTKATGGAGHNRKVTNLETSIAKKTKLMTDQKRNLKAVKEECREELEAVESKFKSVVAINRKLENHIIDLFGKMEAVSKRTRRNVSTAQDVLSLTERGGFNSPSCSLSYSSSEGFSASSVLAQDYLPSRDLHSVLDTPETYAIPEMGEFEDIPGPSAASEF